MKTWILVANAAEAKFLTTDNLRLGELKLSHELTHPDSRKKTSELMTDKPGHFKLDSSAHSAYSKSDPKETEAEHFAVQLVRELQAGWGQNKYKSLIIVAPAHFYGLIKKHFHDKNALEIKHVPKDYTKYTLLKLHSSLKQHLII